MNRKRNKSQQLSQPHSHPPASQAVAASATSLDLAKSLRLACSVLFGMLVIWAFLQPVDATSVFGGDAQPQNLFWLFAGLLAAAAAVSSRSGVRFQSRDWALACAALAWMVCVTWLAGRDNNPRIAWYGFWQVMGLANCYFVARFLADGPRTRAAMVTIVLAGNLALAIHGLHQVTVSFPRDRAAYELNPEAMLEKIGIDAPTGSAERRRLEDRLLNSPEPYATFALANSLATSLTAGIVLLLGLAVWPLRKYASVAATGSASAEREALAKWRSIALAAAILLVLATWLLTRSRTAYLAVVIAIAYWLLLSKFEKSPNASRRSIWITALAGLAVAAVCSVWIFVNDRLVISESFYSLQFRLEYWAATLEMLKEYWLTGVGLGNFQSYYPTYKLELASETIADAHNWPLDIAATLSVPIALFMSVWLVGKFWPPPQRPADTAAAEMVMHAQSSDAAQTRALFLGAGVGGAFCAGLMWLLSSFDPEATALGWSVAATTALILWPLTRRMVECDSAAIRAAALAIVVCQLASGSWQASGIAVPLLVLIAVFQTKKQSESALRTRWELLILPALGMTAFIFQSWFPTTRSWALAQQLADARSVDDKLSVARAAQLADRFDTQSLQWQAELMTERTLQSPLDQFAGYAAQAVSAYKLWLKADQNNFIHWQFAGNHLISIAATARRNGIPERAWLETASHFYIEAAKRYPSSVSLQLQSALIAKLLGEDDVSLSFLVEAERLSEATPHLDKKLGMQEVWLPASLVAPELAKSLPPGTIDRMPAEPVAAWLRTALVPN